MLVWLLCVWHVCPWVYLVWDSLDFLDLGSYFLSYVKEVFGYNLFKYIFRAFLFLFFFCDPYNLTVGVFNVVPGVSEIVLIFFIIFSLFILQQQFSLFCLPAHISIIHPVILLSIHHKVFFKFSVIVLFISVCSFFSSSFVDV